MSAEEAVCSVAGRLCKCFHIPLPDWQLPRPQPYEDDYEDWPWSQRILTTSRWQYRASSPGAFLSPQDAQNMHMLSHLHLSEIRDRTGGKNGAVSIG